MTNAINPNDASLLWSYDKHAERVSPLNTAWDIYFQDCEDNDVDQPKQLDQSVFEGLPMDYRWAAVDAEGDAFAFDRHPPFIRDGMWLAEVGYRRLGHGFDATNWGSSLIERKCPVCKVATDVAPLGLDGECQMCYEDATDKACDKRVF